MEHMEYVSKKIVALGGVPTTKPAAINAPAKWRDMVEADLAAENMAIEHYKAIAAMADELDDVDLRKSIEDITSGRIRTQRGPREVPERAEVRRAVSLHNFFTRRFYL